MSIPKDVEAGFVKVTTDPRRVRAWKVLLASLGEIFGPTSTPYRRELQRSFDAALDAYDQAPVADAITIPFMIPCCTDDCLTTCTVPCECACHQRRAPVLTEEEHETVNAAAALYGTHPITQPLIAIIARLTRGEGR